MCPQEVCEDCDPSQTQSGVRLQPASASSMAHEPSRTQPVGIPTSPPSDADGSTSRNGEFKPPVPVDPPSKAGHATEFTMHGPPTPTIENQARRQDTTKQDQGQKDQGVPEKGDLTPPEENKHQADAAAPGFVAPNLGDVKPSIIIEFCDRCRWAPRATWIQTELFLTFPTPLIRTITLIPLNAPETGGRFRVWVDVGAGKKDELVWDRKTEGGFPELKVLKQRIRNLIQPDLNLGHSDTHGKQEKETGLAN
ncbi:uncharacterized protein I303_103360 [Kwoniella dejecticola CBS 10117]|uniref:Selenoprotein W n=1 Tax=Kwoniella dejecticola CBS 10117 TaxID=1296121 RepID=A0A1A6A6I4_9TREE|nr:selenoprotein W [Kwoniella dejecticola CBS 10117]OBR85672.1 selenoprotein W [Kwoniella dejecticola CBS 10117]